LLTSEAGLIEPSRTRREIFLRQNIDDDYVLHLNLLVVDSLALTVLTEQEDAFGSGGKGQQVCLCSTRVQLLVRCWIRKYEVEHVLVVEHSLRDVQSSVLIDLQRVNDVPTHPLEQGRVEIKQVNGA